MLQKIKKTFKNRVKIILMPLMKNSCFDEVFTYDVLQTVKIVNTELTLNSISNSISNEIPGAYMRFGDGDVFLMENIDDSFQKKSVYLSLEMREAFSICKPGVYKCLAIHSELFGFEQGMTSRSHKISNDMAINLFRSTFQFFIGQLIYSPVALHHLASENPILCAKFLKNLKDKTNIFIGNKEINNSTINRLFSPSHIIDSPKINAYDAIDIIHEHLEKIISKSNSFQVVVIAMGCAGRVLMKRILENERNVFLFDFGSLLDGFDGNDSRAWLKEKNIDYDLIISNI